MADSNETWSSTAVSLNIFGFKDPVLLGTYSWKDRETLTQTQESQTQNILRILHIKYTSSSFLEPQGKDV